MKSEVRSQKAEPGIDIVALIALGSVCACGKSKLPPRLFCDACWANLPPIIWEQWNDLCLKTKGPVFRSPHEARRIYRVAFKALGIKMPKVKFEADQVEVAR